MKSFSFADRHIGISEQDIPVFLLCSIKSE